MSLYESILETLGEDADDWEADDCSLTCPCGHRIEPDCPSCVDGCKNPIMLAGLI